MCGIIGIFGTSSISSEDREEVNKGAEWMRLRGPDGGGFAEDAGVYFGHRRLAILDPALGHQPWVDAATGTILVFNGELFNFSELRRQLIASGFDLRTSCDTEVLMAAYLRWGRGCLERLNGMFAFALYDPREGLVWLARDRLGVKPLYYQLKDGRLRFASSLKSMFAFPSVERRLDVAAAWHYLRTIRITLGERTLIEDVKSLEPGQELWWSKSSTAGPELKFYWDLQSIDQLTSDLVPKFEESCEIARQRVEQAVARQMISDVPLGGFLSGGLDSSILSNVASSAASEPIGTFSVGYDKEGFNEWDSIRENVAFNALQNEEIHLDESEYETDWRWLISEKGAPLSTPNEVPIYRLARSFGSRYKVALSGEGADEVFGGYVVSTFCAYDWDRVSGGGNSADTNAIYAAYGTKSLGSRQDHFFRVNSWIDANRLRTIIRPELASKLSEDPVEAYYQSLFDRSEERSTFDAYLRVHARINLEGLLSRLDTSTMAASVEGRVPFTDHSLVEWLFSLPDAYKMSLGNKALPSTVGKMSVHELDRMGFVDTKRLLRHGFKDRVPRRVFHQPKVSFPVPFMSLLEEQWQGLYRTMLADDEGPANLLQETIRSSLKRSSSTDVMLAWPLLNLFLWQKEFNVALMD